MDSNKVRVIVVGGGIVGACIAWNLVRQGAEVTVIAPDIGGTATRDSFAWLNATWRNTRDYYDFRRRSMEAWKRLTQDMPKVSAHMRWGGSLQWDMSPEELERFEKEHGAWGYDIHRIEREQLHKLEPWLAPDTLPEWALRIGEEGAVEASAVAETIIAQVQAHGGRLVSTPVARLLKENDAVEGIVLETGEEHKADHVVLAAGVGSKQLCETAGIELPVSSRDGLLVHSKPLSKHLLSGLVLAPGLHIRQTVEGRLVAGAGFAGSDAGEDPQKTADSLFAKVKDLFNADVTKDTALEMDFYSVGRRPMPLDGLPILGNAGVQGLSLAVMHSGVTLAPLAGEILAEEIIHGKKDPAAQAFNISRFV